MVKSMTGYGKSECVIKGTKYTVEISSVNGKNIDISLRTSLIPRDKEMGLRSYITNQLGRGSIYLYITKDVSTSCEPDRINKNILKGYYDSMIDVFSDTPLSPFITSPTDSSLACTLLKLPGVVDMEKTQFCDEDWNILFKAIEEATNNLNKYREIEGQSLRNDVLTRIENILSYIPEVEKYEKVRVEAIKERIFSRISELIDNPDMNRFEQEMIYYIEKLDINEEKVRLRQHCKYFKETIDTELMPGKKIGFITQEIGREINTLGSKSNNAEMQSWVVKMKDELEKIKEQSLNIL